MNFLFKNCYKNINSKYIPVIEIKIYDLFILKTLKYPKYAIDKVTLTYVFFGGFLIFYHNIKILLWLKIEQYFIIHLIPKNKIYIFPLIRELLF